MGTRADGEPVLPGGLWCKKDVLKYLGVYLEDTVMQRNWKGVLEAV